jgi:hypothetical protein
MSNEAVEANERGVLEDNVEIFSRLDETFIFDDVRMLCSC